MKSLCAALLLITLLRDDNRVELWLVPPGSPLPKPTPEVFRPRRGRR